MTHVAELDVDQFKVYRIWNLAPVGALLQLEAPELKSPIIGLRCQLLNKGSPDAVLVLAGDGAGAVPEAHMIFQRPAIDVTDHLVVCLKDPIPQAVAANHRTYGKAYTPKDGSRPTTVLMWFETSGDDAHAGFICLSGSERGHELDQGHNVQDHLEIGRVVTVSRDEIERRRQARSFPPPVIVTAPREFP